MSTLLVNKIKSVTGDSVTISGSNIIVQGKTTLGDTQGTDTIQMNDDLIVDGEISGSSAARLPGVTIGSPFGSIMAQGVISGSSHVRLPGVAGGLIPVAQSGMGSPLLTTLTSGQLFTLSGSQIFSASAFQGGGGDGYVRPFVSSALFVFRKP